MKKTYKIDVDCANCANKMEDAANKTPGVKSAVVNFMTLKMHVEFEEGQDPKSVTTAKSSCKPPIQTVIALPLVHTAGGRWNRRGKRSV